MSDVNVNISANCRGCTTQQGTGSFGSHRSFSDKQSSSRSPKSHPTCTRTQPETKFSGNRPVGGKQIRSSSSRRRQRRKKQKERWAAIARARNSFQMAQQRNSIQRSYSSTNPPHGVNHWDDSTQRSRSDFSRFGSNLSKAPTMISPKVNDFGSIPDDFVSTEWKEWNHNSMEAYDCQHPIPRASDYFRMAQQKNSIQRSYTNRCVSPPQEVFVGHSWDVPTQRSRSHASFSRPNLSKAPTLISPKVDHFGSIPDWDVPTQRSRSHTSFPRTNLSKVPTLTSPKVGDFGSILDDFAHTEWKQETHNSMGGHSRLQPMERYSFPGILKNPTIPPQNDSFAKTSRPLLRHTYETSQAHDSLQSQKRKQFELVDIQQEIKKAWNENEQSTASESSIRTTGSGRRRFPMMPGFRNLW